MLYRLFLDASEANVSPPMVVLESLKMKRAVFFSAERCDNLKVPVTQYDTLSALPYTAYFLFDGGGNFPRAPPAIGCFTLVTASPAFRQIGKELLKADIYTYYMPTWSLAEILDIYRAANSLTTGTDKAALLKGLPPPDDAVEYYLEFGGLSRYCFCVKDDSIEGRRKETRAKLTEALEDAAAFTDLLSSNSAYGADTFTHSIFELDVIIDDYKSYNVKFLSSYVEDNASLKWVHKMNNGVLTEMFKLSKIPFSATLAGWLLEKVVLNAFTSGGTFKKRAFVGESKLQDLTLPPAHFHLFRKFDKLTCKSIAEAVSNASSALGRSAVQHDWPMNVLLMPSASNFAAIDAILIYRLKKQEPMHAFLLQITLNTAHNALPADDMRTYLKRLRRVFEIESNNISLVTVTTADRVAFMQRLQFEKPDSAPQELKDLQQFAIAVDVPFTPETLQEIASVSKKRKRRNPPLAENNTE